MTSTSSTASTAADRVISVVIADDQRLVRAGFRVILAGEPDIRVVGEAADGLEAIDLARTLAPAVVLMDIRMPNMDGLAEARRILGSRDELVVEESTVKTHVSRILMKLGLRDRIQAVVIAYESGFVVPDDSAGRA